MMRCDRRAYIAEARKGQVHVNTGVSRVEKKGGLGLGIQCPKGVHVQILFPAASNRYFRPASWTQAAVEIDRRNYWFAFRYLSNHCTVRWIASILFSRFSNP